MVSHTIAIIISLVMIFPVVLMLGGSLKPNAEVFNMNPFPRIETITLQNYSEVFSTQPFLLYVYNTLIVAVAVAVAGTLFHSMSGFALAKLHFRGRRVIFGWILSTMMIPFTVIMIPLFLIVRSMGLTNSLLGVILPSIPQAWGIFLFRQFMMELPDDLIEAAKIDGASFARIFATIVFPLCKAIALTIATALFLANWNAYIWPLIVIQDRNRWLLQIAMANFFGQYRVEWNRVLAASTIASIPTVLLFAIFQKYIVRGIKLTGIKA